MKVTVIPIVICALGTVTKRFVQGLEELERRQRVEIIQTTALLRLTRILRRVLDLMRLDVTQTPVKNYRLKLVWKIQERVNKDDWALLRNWKKKKEHKNDRDTNCNQPAWYSHQRIIKGLEKLKIRSRIATI